MNWFYVAMTVMAVAAVVLVGYALHLALPDWQDRRQDRKIRKLREHDLAAPTFAEWAARRPYVNDVPPRHLETAVFPRHLLDETAEMSEIPPGENRHYSDETSEMRVIPPVPPRRDPV